MSGVQVTTQNGRYVIQCSSEAQHTRLCEALEVFCDAATWHHDSRQKRFVLSAEAYGTLYDALKSEDTPGTRGSMEPTPQAADVGPAADIGVQTTQVQTHSRETQTESMFTVPKVVVSRSPVEPPFTAPVHAVPAPAAPQHLKPKPPTETTAPSIVSQSRSVIMSVKSSNNGADDFPASEISGMSDWEAYDAKRRRVQSVGLPHSTHPGVIGQNAPLQHHRPL